MRPTREGRHTPARHGLVFLGIGVDPDEVPDDEIPQPTDWAWSSNSGYIQVANRLTIVDDPDDLNLSDGTVTDGGGSAPNSFLTPERANDNDNLTRSERQGFAAGAGTYTSRLDSDLGAAFLVDSHVILGNWFGGDPGWTVWYSADDVTYTEAAITSSWNSSTMVSTITLDTPISRRYWRIQHSVTLPGTQFTPGLDVYTWAISGSGTTYGDTLWYPGPAVNDGDDASYNLSDTAAEACLRVFLTAARVVYRAELRIATETAGSRTYEIYGDTDPEFGSAVLLDSVTFTATGSYTAQEVVFEWTPAAAYAYYEIRGPEEIRNFHDLNLFGAFAPGGGATAHPGLSGRGVTDQHPAASISLTDSAGLFTGTNAETGMAELAAKAIGYQAHGNTGATETFDAATGWHSATLNANCTFALTGAAAGTVSSLFLELTQDGTGGRTITLPASVVNKSDIEADQVTTASTTAFLVLLSRDGGTTWYGGWWGQSGGASALDDLTDVTITAPAEGDALRYNGSAWVNSDLYRAIVTDGFDSLVWEGDDLVWEWSS